MFSSGLVKDLTDFMKAHFFWQSGEWKLILSCSVGVEPYSREFKFNLSAADIESMKAVSQFYEFGLGVHSMARLPQMPGAKASVVVTIQEP